MGRTSPVSDTLKISAPPNVLPNAANSFADPLVARLANAAVREVDFHEPDAAVLAKLQSLQQFVCIPAHDRMHSCRSAHGNPMVRDRVRMDGQSWG